jgi:hypothetical protein
MKSKTDFTGRPSEAHDVLDPPATGRGVLGGQRLSGLIKALALFEERRVNIHVISFIKVKLVF